MPQAPFLHSSVLQSVLQPLLLQYTTALKSVLMQYTILLISVHHGALLMQYTTCAKIQQNPLPPGTVDPICTLLWTAHQCMSQQTLLGLASLDPLRESQLLQYHPAYSWHTQKRLLHFFRASCNFLENQFLGEAPPSVCLRCWNFLLHRTIYSGLRLHSQGNTLQANGPGPLLLSSVLHSEVCTPAVPHHQRLVVQNLVQT